MQMPVRKSVNSVADLKKYNKGDDKFVAGFIRDIKTNKLAYVRSPKIVELIKQAEPDIQFEYVKDEDIYIAKYNKPFTNKNK
jgi:hypothetical protein